MTEEVNKLTQQLGAAGNLADSKEAEKKEAEMKWNSISEKLGSDIKNLTEELKSSQKKVSDKTAKIESLESASENQKATMLEQKSQITSLNKSLKEMQNDAEAQ